MKKKPKILYGICGIGNGHTYRQLPLVEYFSKRAKLMLFVYDQSYTFFSSYFKKNSRVKIVRVAVPFWTGDKDGLNFKKAIEEKINQQQNFFLEDSKALAEAQKFLGKPDLVISDNEPVSAQYAYAHSAPLVIINQQNKFLAGNFPKKLAGFTFEDEIQRLNMFFPRADARIACSFFQVTQKKNDKNVLLFPPTFSERILTLKRQPTKKTSLLAYISSAREFVQTVQSVAKICATQKNVDFHIFVPKDDVTLLKNLKIPNIAIYPHGDSQFIEVLKTCSGIISSAGHSLLSEAMYLGIPVYAIPVSPYEQHLNALIINKYGFGLNAPKLSEQKLSVFIRKLPLFSEQIKKDNQVLLRGIGQEKIIKFINQKFLKNFS